MFATEVFIEFIERSETFTENHLKVGEDIAGEIERIMLGIIFPTRFENSQIFEIFEFTADSIDLLIYITTELSDKEVFFWIKRMLQEEFFEEFFSAV
jgi:hypothetical protein